MVPIGSLAEIKEVTGPQTVNRFNLYPSIKVMGQNAPGFSSGEALTIMEDMAAEKLPDTMGYNWADLSYQEKQASGGSEAIFLFAILMVYLFLAAQYESWSLPISVVMAVPPALLGAVIAVSMRGYDYNVYTQIGIVLLIALSTKSAILIVEFCKLLREEGATIFDAAIEATRARFRAVLMTAFSFILGVIPLLIATGAGAESQKVIGTAVFGGMIVATVMSLAAVPMLYYVVQRTAEGAWGKKGAAIAGIGKQVVVVEEAVEVTSDSVTSVTDEADETDQDDIVESTDAVEDAPDVDDTADQKDDTPEKNI
jgi:HAE1 family hydrophobic/amphiphilic exporter-1